MPHLLVRIVGGPLRRYDLTLVAKQHVHHRITHSHVMIDQERSAGSCDEIWSEDTSVPAEAVNLAKVSIN